MPRARTLFLGPLLASAALVLPAAANANTFCVNALGCPAGGVSTGGDLQAALDAASGHTGVDTVLVGDKGSPYVGPFTYAPLSRALDPVTIKSDGAGRPVLSAGVGDTVMTLDVGATLSGIDVAMPSAVEGTGIVMRGATLQDVTVSSAPGGPGAVAIVAAAGQSALDHVRVTATGDDALSVQGEQLAGFDASVTARNLQISGALVGVDVNSTGRFSATQSRLSAASIGVNSHGSTTLDRVAVATSGASSTGIIQSDASLALEHVTVAHEGPGSGSDTALSLHATTSDPPVSLQDSALAGYAHGIQRTVTAGHTVAITAASSVWNPAGDQLGPASSGSFHEAGDVRAEPALVSLFSGDLRPRGSSGQIDLDAATDPASYADLQGAPAVDGNGDGSTRPDAGALEYRRVAPTITTIDAPAGGTAGSSLAFNATASDLDGDRVQVRWDFGDGATATTASTTHAYTAPGSYNAAVSATDEAGLTDRRTLTITITPGAPTGTTPVGPAGGTPPHPKTLILRGLRLTPSRTSIKLAGRVRLRLTANERAIIRIVASRPAGRRIVQAHPIKLTATAGSNAIALAGALRGLRPLKPGRLTLTVTASDSAGHHTGPRTLQLTLLP